MSEPHDAPPTSSERGSGSVPVVPSPVRRRHGRRSSTRNAVEWLVVIIGAVLVALLIKTFVVQAFRIPSDSMVPTLTDGDRVLVNKLSYDAHELNRGDVVVFERPADLPAAEGDPEDLIKRVIGLPGETLVSRDGTVYVDDRALTEPYLPAGTMTFNMDAPVTVPEGHILVMGDNRGNSTDGRSFGPISTDTVIGRAFMIMWPPGRIGAL